MKISVSDSELEIVPGFKEKMLGMHGSFKIPWSNIASISTEKADLGKVLAKIAGTSIPGVKKAGTFQSGDGKEYWYASRNTEYITIDLQNESYKKIVLSVDDSAKLEKEIKEKLG